MTPPSPFRTICLWPSSSSTTLSSIPSRPPPTPPLPSTTSPTSLLPLLPPSPGRLTTVPTKHTGGGKNGSSPSALASLGPGLAQKHPRPLLAGTGAGAQSRIVLHRLPHAVSGFFPAPPTPPNAPPVTPFPWPAGGLLFLAQSSGFSPHSSLQAPGQKSIPSGPQGPAAALRWFVLCCGLNAGASSSPSLLRLRIILPSSGTSTT